MKLNNKSPKKTATEATMEYRDKMMREYNETITTDDKLFRATILARLDTIEQMLGNIYSINERRII